MSNMLNPKEFVSIAEAVAYYFKQGYHTVDYTEHHRVMRRDNSVVVISPKGFLLVSSYEM